MIFAKEKSEYSHLIWKNIEDFNLSEKERRDNLSRIQEIEQYLKTRGDEIMVIVTTKNTNPMTDNCAPPMSMENINELH